MNIEKLIEAAKEIDRLAEQSSARAKAWQTLAADAKKQDADWREIERRRQKLDAGVVVDFSSAIDKLRSALNDQLQPRAECREAACSESAASVCWVLEVSMEWKRLKVDGHPPCDGETVFVGVNEAGFCGCFNQHGMMSLANGPVSVCFYDTAEGSHEVMTCLDYWAVLDVPTPFARIYGCIPDEVPNNQVEAPAESRSPRTPC